MAATLEVRNLVARYGDFQALFGIDFAMARGSIVALIGANGAGKSTFLKAMAGQMTNKQGEIRFEDREIGALASDEIVAAGIAMVPEGRRLFRSLTVEENLKVGAFSGRTGRWTLDFVYALFPVLRERRQSPATALSGGQQQMVAIGRGLMSNPLFSFAMRFRSDLRQLSSRISTPSSPRSAPRAFPSSSSSRTLIRRCEQPTTSIVSCTVG